MHIVNQRQVLVVSEQHSTCSNGEGSLQPDHTVCPSDERGTQAYKSPLILQHLLEVKINPKLKWRCMLKAVRCCDFSEPRITDPLPTFFFYQLKAYLSFWSLKSRATMILGSLISLMLGPAFGPVPCITVERGCHQALIMSRAHSNQAPERPCWDVGLVCPCALF